AYPNAVSGWLAAAQEQSRRIQGPHDLHAPSGDRPHQENPPSAWSRLPVRNRAARVDRERPAKEGARRHHPQERGRTDHVRASFKRWRRESTRGPLDATLAAPFLLDAPR